MQTTKATRLGSKHNTDAAVDNGLRSWMKAVFCGIDSHQNTVSNPGLRLKRFNQSQSRMIGPMTLLGPIMFNIMVAETRKCWIR